MDRRYLAVSALVLLILASPIAIARADDLVAPKAGDACAAQVPALFKSETNLPLSKVLLNKTWSSQGAWTYDVPVAAGYLEYIFTDCAASPHWLNVNFVWRKRAVPIQLTLSSGAVRSISAALVGAKPVIRAKDNKARSVSTVFAPKEEIFIGIHHAQNGLEAGFGVTHSDYCATIVETAKGPTVQWCGG